MTKSDVAALLRCCERTVERQVKLNAFPPPQRFGKESLWFQSIVFAWLEKRRELQQQWVAQEPAAVEAPVLHTAPSMLPPVLTAPPKKSTKSPAKDWPGKAQAQSQFQCAES